MRRSAAPVCGKVYNAANTAERGRRITVAAPALAPSERESVSQNERSCQLILPRACGHSGWYCVLTANDALMICAMAKMGVGSDGIAFAHQGHNTAILLT
jgi:hypothetical protein